MLQECAQAADTEDEADVRNENEGEESENKQENGNEDDDDGTRTIRTDEDTEDETESEEEEVDIVVELPEEVPYRRLPCMVHTMQLVVKEACGHNQYSNFIAKAKRVVSTIRRSSIAVEELVNRCGRSVIADCITRWNSTYFMTKRLLTIHQYVNYALNHIGEDSLLASEWNRLEELASLLEPFTVCTNLLQTDTRSLSTVLPALFELEEHLHQGLLPNTARSARLKKFDLKFACVLRPEEGETFNPLPAVATLLDPTVAVIMLQPRAAELLAAAKRFVNSYEPQASDHNHSDDSTQRDAAAATDNSVSVCPPALKKLKLMSNKVAAERQLIQTRNSNTAKDQLEHYIGDIRMLSVENAFDYWMERRNSYNRLVSLALDLLAAPASQA